MMAPVRNVASRINVMRLDWNGLMIPIDPATIAVIKKHAPISSPMANDPEPESMALNVLNRSGLPFPKANTVTPAMLSESCNLADMVWRLGQKKSDATTLTAPNNNSNAEHKAAIAIGFHRLVQ